MSSRNCFWQGHHLRGAGAFQYWRGVDRCRPRNTRYTALMARLLLQRAELVVEHRLADHVQRHGVQLVLRVDRVAAFVAVSAYSRSACPRSRRARAEQRRHLFQPGAVEAGADSGPTRPAPGAGISPSPMVNSDVDALAEQSALSLNIVRTVGSDTTTNHLARRRVVHPVLAVVILQRHEQERRAHLLLEQIAEHLLRDRRAVAWGTRSSRRATPPRPRGELHAGNSAPRYGRFVDLESSRRARGRCDARPGRGDPREANLA